MLFPIRFIKLGLWQIAKLVAIQAKIRKLPAFILGANFFFYLKISISVIALVIRQLFWIELYSGLAFLLEGHITPRRERVRGPK